MMNYAEEYRLLRDSVADLRDSVSKEGEVRTQEQVIDRLDLILGRFPKKEPLRWEPPKVVKVLEGEEAWDHIRSVNGPYLCEAVQAAIDTMEESLRDEFAPRVARRQRIYDLTFPGFGSGEHAITHRWVVEEMFKPMGLIFWEADGCTVVTSVRMGSVEQLGEFQIPAFMFECRVSFKQAKEWASKNMLRHQTVPAVSELPVLNAGHAIEVTTIGRFERVAVWGVEASEYPY